MMNLEQIILFSRETGLPSGREKQALAEYLQCVILQIIASSEFVDKLSFIGGTSLRFFYGLPRFSEDLDFDNFDLSEDDFGKLINVISKNLIDQGFSIECSIKIKGAYHCYVRFDNLLFQNRLSAHASEKILVKIDTVQQDFDVKKDKKFFNRYGIVEEMNINTLDILMAQKILAILGRKTAKGRDFFDFTFLDGLTKPNMAYLEFKIGIKTMAELKDRLLARCEEVNFKEMVRDVEPFLFNHDDIVRIAKFPQYIEGWKV